MTFSGSHLTERNDEIARLYAEGDLTLREIGKRFNLSHERVRQIGERASVTPGARSERLKKRHGEIIRLYRDGLEVGEIGERFNLSHDRVRQIARAAHLPPRRRGRPSGWRNSALAKRNEEIIRLYVEKRLALTQVAALSGLNPMTVSDILREAGVSRRKPGPPQLHMTERNQETVRSHDSAKSPIEDMRERTLHIVHLYVDKRLSLREVATCVGLNHVTVLKELERAGVSRRRVSGPQLSLMQRNEEITRLYREEGLTQTEIGGCMDLSPKHVSRILKGLGVSRSQRGSGKALR
jgi:DNA-directed RNA polymerase specialized sigma subunit